MQDNLTSDQNTDKPTDWKLSSAKINAIQQNSLQELVRRCKASHYADVHVRINGQWEVFQADWIKHLERA